MGVAVRTSTEHPDPGVRSWSTLDVEPGRALAYWCDSVSRAILELGVECPEGEDFRARLEQCPLGPATLNFVEATSQSVVRTAQSIARSRAAQFHLLHLRSGQCELAGIGRSAVLRAGDCVLLDSDRPHSARCPVPTGSLIVQFPKNWLRAWLPEPESFVGRVLRPREGWSAALAAALASLEPGGLENLVLARGVVAEQIAALLALASGHPAAPLARGDRLRTSVLRTLRDRYHEVGLSPVSVAEAHGISKRYLHLLFASVGTTFGKQLLNVRLERARQLLRDERFGDVPIGEIAARCGFAAPSHFARCYRRRFGLAPGTYRGALRRRATRIALPGARAKRRTRNLAAPVPGSTSTRGTP
jgi:AraC family transcriptional regulator, positive regulator of tynA and feaB